MSDVAVDVAALIPLCLYSLYGAFYFLYYRIEYPLWYIKRPLDAMGDAGNPCAGAQSGKKFHGKSDQIRFDTESLCAYL